MNHEATAKVMKRKDGGKKGPAHSVTFKKVNGGIISTTQHSSPDDPESPYGHSSVESVHKSLGAAKKHMDACFGGGDTPEEEAAEEAGK